MLMGLALAAWTWLGSGTKILPADAQTQALVEWAVARGTKMVRARLNCMPGDGHTITSAT